MVKRSPSSLLISLEHFIDLISTQLAPSSKKKSSGDWTLGVKEYCSLESDAILCTCELVRASKKAEWAVGRQGTVILNPSQKALGMVANGGNRILTNPFMVLQIVSILKPQVCLLADPNIRLYEKIHDPMLQLIPSSDSQERKAHQRWIKYLDSIIPNIDQAIPIWVCVGGSRAEVGVLFLALGNQALHSSHQRNV